MGIEPQPTRLVALRRLLADLAITGDVAEVICEIVRARSPRRLDEPATGSPVPRLSLSAVARRVYRISRSRSTILGADLCPDPAWHMLVDLFAAGQEGRSVSVSSLCLASGVPQSTGLRQLNLAAAAGLIARALDTHDGRRVLVGMTDNGNERVGSIITGVREMLDPPDTA